MSKKEIINKIESLFDDLGSESSSDLPVAEEAVEVFVKDFLSGWHWSCNSEGIIQECSPEVIQVLGIAHQEWLGKSLFTFNLTQASADQFHIEVEKARKDQQPFEQEVVYQSKDGRFIPVKISAFPIIDEDEEGRISLSGWRGMAFVLHSPSQPSQDSSLPLSTAPDSMPGYSLKGFYLQDELLLPASKLISPASLESFKTGSPVVKPGGLHSPAVMAVPVNLPGQELALLEFLDGNPSRVWTEDELHLVVQVVEQLSLILDNARLFEEQSALIEKMRELDQLKSLFFANMSHELRTPLNSIIGFSHVITTGIDGPVTPLQQQDLAAIHNAGQHLLRLIDDILDISKIEAGKMELVFIENVDLVKLIHDTLTTVVGLTKDKPIQFETNIPETLPLVRADPTRIRQVLINFLSNAVKFTVEGSIRVTAKVQTGVNGNFEIRVSVTDRGPGISREDQANLFQPFYQADSSTMRKVPGTGLGLSISRMLIELHRGRIGVESETGQGSTFYFTLPLPSVDPRPVKSKF